MPRRFAPSLLGFLMLMGLALLGSSCGGGQLPSPDGGNPPPNCANVGCSAPPLCSVGCQATCGCCSCSPGERNGELVCTSQGCYAPAPASDGGVDGGEVCGLPFDPGPCRAAIPVYAMVAGDCVARIYGGCEGNGNRFSTLEECIATCAAKAVNGCPPNRAAREICLACGPAGGCASMATVCALVCNEPVDASPTVCPPSLTCYDQVCQYAAFCI